MSIIYTKWDFNLQTERREKDLKLEIETMNS